jgi:8-oxo-dGTP pyrophosphatase MutT (NUDIX family)
MTSYYRDPAAPSPNVPRRIGVMALLERDGEVLVERRADNDADEWAFIGGGLDENETILEALHREVREETGFAIESAKLFGLFSDPTRIIAYPDGNVAGFLTVVFRAAPSGSADPALSDESLEMRFVEPDALAALDFWPAHRPIREAFLDDPQDIVVA